MDEVGDRNHSDTGRDAIGRIGDEETIGLLRFEERLRRLAVRDERIDAVRDQMLSALEFRRRQLSPDRLVLGDSPLQRAQLALGEQLDRFRLTPVEVAEPEIRATAGALLELRRFADEPLRTHLAGVTADGQLAVIDIDGSTVSRREIPPPEAVFGGGSSVLALAGGTLTAFPLDRDAAPAWSRPALQAVSGRSPGTAAWVVDGPGRATPVTPDGTDAGPGVALAPDAALLADTGAGLVVSDAAGLRLIDARTGAALRSFGSDARFTGASAGLVAVQRSGRPMLEVHFLATDEVIEVPLPRTDAGGSWASRRTRMPSPSPPVRSPATSRRCCASTSPIGNDPASMPWADRAPRSVPGPSPGAPRAAPSSG